MSLSIQKKISTMLSRIPTKVYYIVIGLLVIPSYIYSYQPLIAQETSYIAIISKFTVNIVLLFFFVGMWVDKATKHMPSWKGWLIWAVVTFAVILFFKYIGGLESRF